MIVPELNMSTFKYRILFVDDEKSIRDTGAAILRSAGYDVLTAEDGLDALKSLAGALPELIITDLRMPRMSGFEFLAVVRHRFPQIPTIAISGEYVTDIVPDGLLADLFLQKGQYEVPDFFAKIRELLSKPPARAFPGTRCTSPIWVALYGKGEVIVTCPQCLRSFDVDTTEMKLGTHEASCTFCQGRFEYNIDKHNMETFLDRTRQKKSHSAKNQ
jgi:CheY-like chemotaxis protein